MEAAQSDRRSLGELFLERGLISEADLERALAEQVATKRRLADILVRRGLVTGHDITNALMEQLGQAAPTPAEPALTSVPDPVPEQPPAEVVALPEPPQPTVAPAPDPDPDPLPAAEENTEAVAQTEPAVPAQPVEDAAHDVSISVDALIAEADSRRRGAEADLLAAREAHAQMLSGLEQVCAELEACDLSAESLAKELERTKTRLRAREDELAKHVRAWDDAHREAERCGTQLAELQARLEEKELELSEATASATAWAARASELDAESEVLAGRIDATLQTLEALALTRFPAESGGSGDAADGPVRIQAPQTGALFFVPKDEGYDLVEREGELPAVGEALELGGEQFVVTKIGRSPLPFDRRSCVFVTAV